MQSEGDEWLFKLPQEVFEETTHHMNVLDLIKHRWSFTLQEALSELLHHTLSPWNPVQTFLNEHKNIYQSDLGLNQVPVPFQVVLLFICQGHESGDHLIQAPPLNLSNAVYHQHWNSGMTCRSKTFQQYLRRKQVS